MCVLFVANKVSDLYPLIIIANRDEFHRRPTAKLAQWPDSAIIAGQDLEALGTWLGVNVDGRIAALTNVRGPQFIKPQPPSRGELVTDYLNSLASPTEFGPKLQPIAAQYSGFNLLYGTADQLFTFNNTTNQVLPITEGCHGLSNAALNDHWPKVQRGVSQLEAYLATTERVDANELVTLMQCNIKAPDHLLPDTGVGIELERFLSPIFIIGDEYGTRCSTILLYDRHQQLTIFEYSYHKDGQICDKVEIKLPR
ncbi:MAG: NRDE family protein [Gammaproteobacteria bacterium]|nr:NRDE family protein [Gammaproteobacteria bacterium]